MPISSLMYDYDYYLFLQVSIKSLCFPQRMNNAKPNLKCSFCCFCQIPPIPQIGQVWGLSINQKFSGVQNPKKVENHCDDHVVVLLVSFSFYFNFTKKESNLRISVLCIPLIKIKNWKCFIKTITLTHSYLYSVLSIPHHVGTWCSKSHTSVQGFPDMFIFYGWALHTPSNQLHLFHSTCSNTLLWAYSNHNWNAVVSRRHWQCCLEWTASYMRQRSRQGCRNEPSELINAVVCW